MNKQEAYTHISGFSFRGIHVPQHMHHGIIEFIYSGAEPGGFLRQVLLNKLFGAFGAADDINILAMPAIVAYVFQCVPIVSYGTPDQIDAWVARGGLEGAKSKKGENDE